MTIRQKVIMRALGIDQSEQRTPDRRLHSRRNADLANDIVDVKVDRSLAHTHQNRNIARRFPARDPCQSLDLAVRQDEGYRRRFRI